MSFDLQILRVMIRTKMTTEFKDHQCVGQSLKLPFRHIFNQYQYIIIYKKNVKQELLRDFILNGARKVSNPCEDCFEDPGQDGVKCFASNLSTKLCNILALPPPYISLG